MKKVSLSIEWSPALNNDIMSLMRSDNEFLSLNNCIFAYLADPGSSEIESNVLEFNYIHSNPYFDKVKEMLVDNLGRSQSHTKGRAVVIGQVSHKGAKPSVAQLSALCDELNRTAQPNHPSFYPAHEASSFYLNLLDRLVPPKQTAELLI